MMARRAMRRRSIVGEKLHFLQFHQLGNRAERQAIEQQTAASSQPQYD